MKRIVMSLLAPFLVLASLPAVRAHCPLCTVAIAGAAVSAKYYGIDVVIIGLFVGAFGISTGIWAGNWINKKLKKQYIKFQLPLIVLTSFLLTVMPLSTIGDESTLIPLFGELYWMNTLLFGGLIGGAVSVFAFGLHSYIKKVKGKVLFPFQGIVLTLILLAATGGILILI